MAAWDNSNRRGPRPPGDAAEQAAAFRNLCRSSPWKWHSLRFEYLDRPLPPIRGTPEAAALRTWSARGCAGPAPCGWRPRTGWSCTAPPESMIPATCFYVSSTRKTWLLPPAPRHPGLRRRRAGPAPSGGSLRRTRLRQRPFCRRAGPRGTGRKCPGAPRIPQLQRRGAGPDHRSRPRGPPRAGSHRHPEPRLPPQPTRSAAVPAGPHPGQDRRRHGRLRRQPLAGRRTGRGRTEDTGTGSGSWL